ncbi:MAG: peptidoglycan bridge formation glycyltransferase FemA/FemB family protein, partial [Oscillospiraceae bacterium]
MVEILSKDKYDEYTEFLENSENSSFTQSLNWTKVKKGWGYEVVVTRDEQNKIIGGMLILIKTIPVCGLSLLYSPRGMICDYHDKKVLRELVDVALMVAKKHHGYLFKIDPYILADDEQAINNLKELGFE